MLQQRVLQQHRVHHQVLLVLLLLLLRACTSTRWCFTFETEATRLSRWWRSFVRVVGTVMGMYVSRAERSCFVENRREKPPENQQQKVEETRQRICYTYTFYKKQHMVRPVKSTCRPMQSFWPAHIEPVSHGPLDMLRAGQGLAAIFEKLIGRARPGLGILIM